MTISLDHIGIAVADLAAVKKLYSLLGLQVGHVESVPSEGLKAHFLTLPPVETHLELLVSENPESTMAKFIAKRGPGIHHLSFRVENGRLDPLCDQLRREGYRLIYDSPQTGAQKMRVNFIHPAASGGVLIELSEPLESDG